MNKSCRKQNPCVVRDYTPAWASGDEQAPIILATQRGFSFDDGGKSNHEEGYLILNLTLRGSGSAAGLFFYNDIDDVDVCQVTISGFAFGVYVAGSNPPEPGSDGKNSNIVLQRSRIFDNTGQGYLGACDGCAIEHCNFENNGYAHAIRNHNIYLDTSGNDMRVVGNELYRSALVDGRCAGVSLVVHGNHDRLLLADNIVREDVGAAGMHCWGIAVDTGYARGPERFRDVTIRGNTVSNVGNVGIGLNACANCVIENNVVIQEQPFHFLAIAAPNRKRGADDGSMMSVTVRNNSVYMGPQSSGVGIVLGGEGTNHVAVSNAVHYSGGARFACFEFGLDPSAYSAVDNNICYVPNASKARWEANAGELRIWAAKSLHDRASTVANPHFRSLAGPLYDLSPNSDSPMIDSGHPSRSAPAAYSGGDRDSKPDIGAYEYRR